MILRPYQSAAAEAIFKEWQENDSTLVVMPTGGGKTILFADVIRRVFPRRALVLAHREELIFQARDKIQRVTGLHADVEMGEFRADGGLFQAAPVVVSTIQTQCSGGDGGGRMAKFDPQRFGLLIIDEAHHATSPTYRRVIDYYRTNPALKVLGVTATPDRADEEALGQVFQSVAFDYEVLDAIHDGWLVPIEQQMVHVEGLDYSSVRTTAGDLNGGDLAAVMEAEKNLQQMASASLAIIQQIEARRSLRTATGAPQQLVSSPQPSSGLRPPSPTPVGEGTCGARPRALVFTASVKAAEMTAEIFNRHRVGMAAWVCGKTDREERRRVLADFAAGKIQVVCNCGVLTEGFDDPGVEVVIMGRPTKSRSLYSQMVGRSTRPLPGVVDGPETAEARKAAIAASDKPSCLVVDFVGNAGRHKLVTSADVLGGKVSEEAVELAMTRAIKAGGPVKMAEALDEAEAELQQRKADAARLAEVARRAKLVATARFTTQSVDPFDVLHLEPVKSRGWDNVKTLSTKQRALLSRSGINPDHVTFAQGKQLIGEILRRWDGNLCSFKQAKTLKKYGYPTEVGFAEASRIIDALAKNGWKRPQTTDDKTTAGNPQWN